MKNKDWSSRMDKIRELLEEYTFDKVTWESDEDGRVWFNLFAKTYSKSPKVYVDPDLIVERSIDDAAHDVLMGGAVGVMKING